MDFNDQIDPQFLTEVALDYFKTLFKDVAKRSVTPRTDQHPEQFIDKVAFFEYTKLPGLITDRFLSIFDPIKPGEYINEEKFVKGFLDCYLSTIDQKM